MARECFEYPLYRPKCQSIGVINGSGTSQSGGGQSQTEDRVGFLKYGEDSDGSG